MLRTKNAVLLLRFSNLKRQLRYMKAVLPTICRAQIRDLVCQGLIRQIQLSFGLTAQLRIMTKHNERFQLVVWFVKLAFLGWERCTSEKMPPWMGGSFFFGGLIDPWGEWRFCSASHGQTCRGAAGSLKMIGGKYGQELILGLEHPVIHSLILRRWEGSKEWTWNQTP